MNVNVLIVDDSATVRQEVRAAIAGTGFNVVEAEDGEDGIRQIRDGEITCVVCDVNMPRKNGIQLVQEIKQDPQYADLPILMLTTEGAQERISQAKAAGAIGWIIKPFKPSLLVAAVQRLAQLTTECSLPN